MKFSRDFIAKALAGAGGNCRELVPVIRKCAKTGCNKARVPQHAEDVEQELWIFLGKHLDKLDEQYNIEPYLIETARNMAMAYQRKFGAYGTDGEEGRSEGMAGLSGSEISSSEEAKEATVVAADQEAAMAYLLSHCPALRNTDQKADEPMQATTTTRRTESTKSDKTARYDVEALKRLRENAGLTQVGMAGRLGIKLPTYQSYEYGRTKGVPKRVMEAARNLSVDPDYSYVVALYGGRPMHEIAREWLTDMGLPLKPAALAKVLNIDKSNASRWMNPNSGVKLSADEMVVYWRRVDSEVKYLEATKKRRGLAEA